MLSYAEFDSPALPAMSWRILKHVSNFHSIFPVVKTVLKSSCRLIYTLQFLSQTCHKLVAHDKVCHLNQHLQWTAELGFKFHKLRARYKPGQHTNTRWKQLFVQKWTQPKACQNWEDLAAWQMSHLLADHSCYSSTECHLTLPSCTSPSVPHNHQFQKTLQQNEWSNTVKMDIVTTMEGLLVNNSAHQ